jgi:hypothetical protein
MDKKNPVKNEVGCKDKKIAKITATDALTNIVNSYFDLKNNTNDSAVETSSGEYEKFITYVNEEVKKLNDELNAKPKLKPLIDSKFCEYNKDNIYALQCAIDSECIIVDNDKETVNSACINNNMFKTLLNCKINMHRIILNGIIEMLNGLNENAIKIVPISDNGCEKKPTTSPITHVPSIAPAPAVIIGGKSRKRKKNNKSRRPRKHNTRRCRRNKK